MIGRKTLFTTALQDRICKLLTRGHTIKTTCGACGLSERGYYDFCAKNPAFLAATLHARAEGRVRIIDSILDDDDWRARAWYLERCWPGEFARSEPRTIVIERPPPVPSSEPETRPGKPERWFTPKSAGIPLDKKALDYLAMLRRAESQPLRRNGAE